MVSLSRLLFLCLIIFLGLPHVFSQTDTEEIPPEENIFQSSLNMHQWGAINSFHGLPSKRVNAIVQTPDGLLWFATDNGLAKFDGKRVQTVTSASLVSVRVLALKIDSSGTLWIGTEKGAFYKKGNSFRLVEETAKYPVRSIFVDSEKSEVYFVNGSGVIFRSSKASDSLIKTETIFSGSIPIRSVSKVGKQVLVGTFNSGILQLVSGKMEAIITQPRPYFINVLKKDSRQRLWVGAKSSRGNTGLFSAENFPGLNAIGTGLGTINAVAFGNADGLWVGTEDRGAYFFKGEGFRKRFTFENTSGGLRSNKILAVFVDREGVVWFGTDKGVNRYDPKSPRNERISDDAQSNFVRTLFKTKDGKLLAGTNRGLFLFREVTNSWNVVSNLERDTIYSILEGDEGRILVGTPAGIVEVSLDNLTRKKILNDEKIRAIANFQKNTFLGIPESGLSKMVDEERESILKSDVITLHNENDKTLWIGTIKNGVFIFDGKIAVQKNELNELKDSAIRSITGNQKDGIWFATDKGLYLFKDNKLKIILAEPDVRKVIVQKDADKNIRVWFAAANGLFHLTFIENFGWISSRIDIEQGLSSQNVFAILPTSENSLLVGTSRGIVRYEKSDLRPLITPNRVLSQRVHSLDELARGIKLDYPQNSLSVEVTAISSRTFSEQFQYAFLLFDGNDKLIKKRFSNEAQFLMDKLLSDKYRVEIRAFDRDLIASKPLIFNFTVEKAPFPWIATILGVLLLIALGALIWAIFSQRKIFRTSNQLAYANKELNTARLDLANEAERERHRISRDLHDQTLADLRHLLLMADDVPNDKAPEFRTEIENVSDEIRRICEDLSPSVLENIGFAASLEWALTSAVEQVSSENKINHEFNYDENLEEGLKFSRAEQIQIYRIAQEVLSNIVRHSNAAEIMVSAKSANGGFVLEIKDDSEGFDPEKSKKGRGLSNIDARAKLIEAKAVWEKQSRSGMLFRLTK